MKVTVLIAVRNGMPWIREAVASVLAQTYRDFELLVVDDASDDDTVSSVTAFGDERIRIVRNDENLGQAPSLNRGLQEARGEYVARLDADDRCLPGRLAGQVALLDAEPTVGVVGAWMNILDERGRRIGRMHERLDDLLSYVVATLVMRVPIAHPAATFRREPVLALGGYDPSLAPSEDHDLWRRLLLDGWDGRIVPETLIEYRVHERQLSQTQSAVQLELDRQSQLRFIEALGPAVPGRALMHLLAGDPAFWSEDEREALRALDPVLAGAAARFGVDRGLLEARIAARVAGVAGRRPWRATRLLAWALRRDPAALSAAAAAPAREAVRLAGRAVPFRGSWMLRRLFGKVAGTS